MYTGSLLGSSSLHAGYELADPTTITPVEALELEHSLGGNQATSLFYWERMLDGAKAVVGARNNDSNKLVGIGLLAVINDETELADLIVHPEHQHKGIARELVRKRVAIADELEISRLKTILVSANTLRPLYQELGFKVVRKWLDIYVRDNPAYQP
jgi:ribosomal protein S18 acetylase RimI-like enzyme